MGCNHDSGDFYVHRCDNGASSRQAGVHALVIGTSEYRYRHKRTTDYDRFADIPGAAFGAGRFAKFLSEGYRDPLDRKILTIRLLLTPTKDEIPALEKLGLTWRLATADAVRTALEEWHDDCDEYPENITILYAAGHGVTDSQSFSHLFLKAEGDRPDPFRYSLNIELIKRALDYNRSQTKIIISDCCRTFLDSGFENGIFVKASEERKKQFARVHRKYDPLYITSARSGARTYALGASEGTMLSYVLEKLLQSAGEIVHHPIQYDERYFAITQDVMTERIWPTFRSHPQAKNIPDSGPQLSGHTVDGGLHRPTPPPIFHVEFVVMDPSKTDSVDVIITTLDGETMGAELVSSKRKLELELAAGTYVQEVQSRQKEFDVDKPRRFDVLSRKTELL